MSHDEDALRIAAQLTQRAQVQATAWALSFTKSG
jgi:hypothetical protein